jgi:hypothetical protein
MDNNNIDTAVEQDIGPVMISCWDAETAWRMLVTYGVLVGVTLRLVHAAKEVLKELQKQ